ncbi:Uncharacterized membrane protein [Propionibacterium cyclohexanicum]|uniref:Uncharacterized membrane protein n=1 Tax=Propionibacterium cyclohexanicum TaxID=64702 RepID=A0A1H9SZJ3_9ACTN|nr:DUF2079 domain-containing protein [Propionibacterium cyclohexanicum]SER90298.1 Uncharacterized membrane protein [Propionibacterium cyclohexanicum]
MRLLTLGAFLLYAVYSLSRFPQFLPAGYDLGIFDQAVRQYSHFQPPYVALKGIRYNLLGDHFHPIIAVLAPLYWLWDDPRVLPIAQAGLVAASIPIVHAVLGDRFERSTRLLLLAGYSFAWPVQTMIDFDFHEIAFAVPLLAGVILALERRRDVPLVVCCLVLLGVREDMGAVVALVGLIRLLRAPRRWLGAALGAAGAVAFVVVTTVIVPHFNAHGSFAYWTFRELGPDAPSAAAFIVTHPLRTVELLFVPVVKLSTWAWLFLPLLLLPFASRYTLLALPLLAERFLSSRPHLWTPQFHYSAPIWVILFCAAIDALRHLPPQRRRLGAKILAITLAGTVLLGLVLSPTNHPLGRLIYPAWRRTPHIEAQQQAVEAIPPDTCVAVDDRLAPRLTKSNRTTLPGVAQPPPDYVILDLTHAEVSYQMGTPQSHEAVYLRAGYLPIGGEDGLVILRRPGTISARPACAPTAP